MNPNIYKIHGLLKKNGLTLAVAESCTGGLISQILTSLSGSSQFFLLGAITYSNSSKTGNYLFVTEIDLQSIELHCPHAEDTNFTN